MRRQHPLGEDASDVLGAADDNGLALEILNRLDLGLGEQRIGRRLNDDAHQRNRRAFVDGADRIDHAGTGRNVVRAGGKLLDHRRVRLREDKVDLDRSRRRNSRS